MKRQHEAEKEDQTGHLCAQGGEGEVRVGPRAAAHCPDLDQHQLSDSPVDGLHLRENPRPCGDHGDKCLQQPSRCPVTPEGQIRATPV